MVIICEAVNRKQILGCIGDMKNITEFKFFRRATNYRVTNMCNTHTLPIGGVNLVMPLVRIPHRQIVEFTSNVVCGTRVLVPIGVNTISGMHLFVTVIIIIGISGPAILGIVPLLVTKLAGCINPWSGAAAATPTATSLIATTATTSLVERAVITTPISAVVTVVTAITTVTAVAPIVAIRSRTGMPLSGSGVG
jgi:hypothetical protein